jgi:ferredoxin/DMSO/TMAO reductase YedYZ heme-binding membrane subunit
LRSGTEAVHMVAATVGFTSFFLIWLSVIWGLILRNGWLSTRLRHATIHGAHMIIAIMGLTLGWVHAFTQLAPPYATTHLVDVVIPFTNPTDPVGIGIGVIAIEIFLAAALSVMIQRRMGFNRWRALHALNHIAFLLVAGHVLISGSDVTPLPVWGAVLFAVVTAISLWVSTAKKAYEVRRAVGGKLGMVQRREEVNIAVDSNMCARFGFCENEAPDVFTLLADGRLSYQVSVPQEQLNEVVRAIDVCPRRAISLTRTPTAVVSAPRPAPSQPQAAANRPAPHATSPRGLRTVRSDELHDRGVPK